MIMRSSWFQKPIYKSLDLITMLVVISGAILICFTPAGWYILLPVVLFWIVFSALASYNISSGVYVSAVCSMPVKEKVVCLTFDDGPCETTEVLLELLKSHKAKATFFMTGSKALEMEPIVKIINQSGHEIGNHSYHHKSWFPLMTVKKIKREIGNTQEVIQKFTGKSPVYFRPPFGVTNPLIAKALKSFDLITIGWSIRSMDTTKRKPEIIIKKILNQIRPGDIVLLHDTSEHIRFILEQVLVYCSQKNYRPVTISELIKSKND